MFGKPKSIYGYFLRQVGLILGSLIFIGIIFLRIIYAGIDQGVFMAANEPALIMENYREQVRTGQRIQELPLSDTVDYLIIDNHTGKIVKSNLAEQKVGTDIVAEGKLKSKSLQLTDQDHTLYLNYNIKLQFADIKLRRRFPNVEYLGFGIGGLVFLLVILGSLKRVQTLLQKENKKLVIITEQLKQEDLAIQIPTQQLKEFEPVYQSLEHLSKALKESIQESIAVQADKEEQISFLVHDLKIPLTIVKGNVELLALEPQTIDTQESFTDIERAIQEMETYIQLIIDFNLNQRGNLSSQTEQIPLTMLLTLLSKSSFFTSSRVQFRDKMSVTGMVQFNQRDFFRALGNIVSNGLERSPEERPVNVTLLTETGCLKIIVEDAGPGFSKEALSAGTKLFFTDNQARNQASAHYGLGLAYAYRVIQAINGDLFLANTNTGHGQVTISLPIL